MSCRFLANKDSLSIFCESFGQPCIALRFGHKKPCRSREAQPNGIAPTTQGSARIAFEGLNESLLLPIGRRVSLKATRGLNERSFHDSGYGSFYTQYARRDGSGLHGSPAVREARKRLRATRDRRPAATANGGFFDAEATCFPTGPFLFRKTDVEGSRLYRPPVHVGEPLGDRAGRHP